MLVQVWISQRMGSFLVALLLINTCLWVEASKYTQYNHDDIDSNFHTDDFQPVVHTRTDPTPSPIVDEKNQHAHEDLDEYKPPLQKDNTDNEEIQVSSSFWVDGKLLFATFIGLAIVMVFFLSSGSTEKDSKLELLENNKWEEQTAPQSSAIVDHTEANKSVVKASPFEHESKNTDRLIKIVIDDYLRKEESEGLSMVEYHHLLEVQTRYEDLVIKRACQLEQKRQTDALEGLARTSAEAFVLKRTRIVFDYFERQENFIRYWSVCTLLLVWALCKLRSLAPRVTDSYLPWWVPRYLIPNGTFIIPSVIIISLVLVVMIIFFTQGNTIASVLIFSIVGLVVLWSLDSTTISSAIFAFLRLFVVMVLFTIVAGFIFSFTYNSKSTSIFSRMWVLTFGLICLLAGCHLGYWVSITDYPNLPTSFEFMALDYLDTLIKSLDSTL